MDWKEEDRESQGWMQQKMIGEKFEEEIAMCRAIYGHGGSNDDLQNRKV